MKINCTTYTNNFGSRQDVLRKSLIFTKDIICAARADALSPQNIERIIKTHISCAKIIFTEKMHNENIAANCKPCYYYLTDNPHKYYLDCLRFNFPIFSKGSDSKGEYVATLVHEATHGFQALDKNISELNILNRELADLTAGKQWDEQITCAGKIFTQDIEDNFVYPLAAMTDKIGNSAGFLPYNFETNIDKLKKYLNLLLRREKSRYPQLRINFAKKLIANYALQEADAYRLEHQARMNYSKKKRPKFSKLLEKIYLDVKKACEQ